MPLIVFTLTPKEGELEAVEAAMQEVIPLVHQEDGCEMYALHRWKNSVMFIEKWRDDAALQAHSGGEAVKGLNEKLKGKVDGRPEIRVLEPRPAGDPAKGQV